MLLRILIAAIGFVGAIFFPPWIPIAVIVILSLRWRAWEAIVLGLFTDLLWMQGGSILHEVPWCTLLAILVVWGLEPLRSEFLGS